MHSMIFNRPLNEKMIRVPPCGSLRRLHRVCSHANHKPAYGEKKGSKGSRDNLYRGDQLGRRTVLHAR